MSHVFCTSDASVVIKSYSPELIVHPLLLVLKNINVEQEYFTLYFERNAKEICHLDVSCKLSPSISKPPFLLEVVYLPQP